MGLYRVELANHEPTTVNATRMAVHNGHLFAVSYSCGDFDPATTETVASWAPGVWVSYATAENCPKCGQPTKNW